jgi:lipopolysaccharide transport system ATP-binding protein
MSHAAIQADGLGKRYRVGEREYYRALRDLVGRAYTASTRLLARSRNGASRNPSSFIWALRNVSFQIPEGQVVGLIGRNGAGKSTLLKILARITKPTEGEACIRGRIGSLLEVGTGFHPELTGRENVYLSGAILGMRKSEINRKFDEIVAFSEVEQFLDSPLKHYSSGMQMRLAFAVAAHLEPEILLVDEVLAVGDIRFQKKCLGKMGDVARTGRTVVLVSHNMAAINALSSRVVLMKDGGIEFDGPAPEATARYYAESLDQAESGASLLDRARQGNGKARFSAVSVQPLTPTGEPLETARPGCDLRIKVEIQGRSQIADCNLAIIIYDMTGVRVIDTNTAQKGEFVNLEAGQNARARFLLHDVLLKPGKYVVSLWLGRHTLEVIDYVEQAAAIDVMGSEETSKHGVIYPGVYLCRFNHDITLH